MIFQLFESHIALLSKSYSAKQRVFCKFCDLFARNVKGVEKRDCAACTQKLLKFSVLVITTIETLLNSVAVYYDFLIKLAHTLMHITVTGF